MTYKVLHIQESPFMALIVIKAKSKVTNSILDLEAVYIICIFRYLDMVLILFNIEALGQGRRADFW